MQFALLLSCCTNVVSCESQRVLLVTRAGNASVAQLQHRWLTLTNATVSSQFFPVMLPNASWLSGPSRVLSPSSLVHTAMDPQPSKGTRVGAVFLTLNLTDGQSTYRGSSVPAFMHHLFIESSQNLLYAVETLVKDSSVSTSTVTENPAFFPYDMYTETDAWTNDSAQASALASTYDDANKIVYLAVQSQPPQLVGGSIFHHVQVSAAQYPSCVGPCWCSALWYSLSQGMLYAAVQAKDTTPSGEHVALLQRMQPDTGEGQNVTVLPSSRLLPGPVVTSITDEVNLQWLIITIENSAKRAGYAYAVFNLSSGVTSTAGRFVLGEHETLLSAHFFNVEADDALYSQPPLSSALHETVLCTVAGAEQTEAVRKYFLISLPNFLLPIAFICHGGHLQKRSVVHT